MPTWSRALSYACDIADIAIEVVNVLLDPLQSNSLIPQPVVARIPRLP